jgi:hypothetical protein
VRLLPGSVTRISARAGVADPQMAVCVNCGLLRNSQNSFIYFNFLLDFGEKGGYWRVLLENRMPWGLAKGHLRDRKFQQRVDSVPEPKHGDKEVVGAVFVLAHSFPIGSLRRVNTLLLKIGVNRSC